MSNSPKSNISPEELPQSIFEVTPINAASLAERLELLFPSSADQGRLSIVLASCYYKLKDFSKSKQYLHQALYTHKEDTNADLWYLIAQYYSKQNDSKLAETAYLSVLRINPNYQKKHKVFSSLGQIFTRSNRADMAIKYFKKALETEEGSSYKRMRNLCYVGALYDRQNSPVKAFNVFSQAWSTLKTVPSVGALAWGHMRMSRFDKAAHCIYEFLSDNSQHNALLYLLALCYMNIDNFSESLKILQGLLTQNPHDGLYLSTCGLLFGLANRVPESYQCLVKCSTLEKERAEVWYNLGLIYEIMGCPNESQSSYETANELNKHLKRTVGSPIGKKDFVYPQIDVIEMFFTQEKTFVHSVPISSFAFVPEDTFSEAQAIQVLSEMSSALPIKRKR